MRPTDHIFMDGSRFRKNGAWPANTSYVLSVTIYYCVVTVNIAPVRVYENPAQFRCASSRCTSAHRCGHSTHTQHERGPQGSAWDHGDTAALTLLRGGKGCGEDPVSGATTCPRILTLPRASGVMPEELLPSSVSLGTRDTDGHLS